MPGVIEIPNPLFMLTFLASDPPVIINRSGNVAGVSRSGAGTFAVQLVEKIAAGTFAVPGVQLLTTASGAVASFAAAIGTTGGDVAVFTRSLAGALADTDARIEVCCNQYPITV